MGHNITKEAMEKGLKMIEPYIHRTPVLSSSLINEVLGLNLLLKCENFQKGGSYKMRGATHAILQLSEEQRERGVVTHSSGNFAQAVSKAAQSLAIKAYIVMPENAPIVKIEGVKKYGGEVILCPATLKDRENTAQSIVQSKGATFLHPSNDLPVILGQGTAAMEMIESTKKLDAIFTPVGGGGLLAGSILARDFFAPDVPIFGAEPINVNDAKRSIISGKIENNSTTHTIADGLRTKLGSNNFPIIKNGVEDILTIHEEKIIEALNLIWTRMKILIEPSSAVTVAAVFAHKEQLIGKNVGVIISGGNVDISPIILHYKSLIADFPDN